MVDISILDFAIVREGDTTRDALQRSVRAGGQRRAVGISALLGRRAP